MENADQTASKVGMIDLLIARIWSIWQMNKDMIRNMWTIAWLVVMMESNHQREERSFNKLWLCVLLAFNKAKERLWVRNKQVLTLNKKRGGVLKTKQRKETKQQQAFARVKSWIKQKRSSNNKSTKRSPDILQRKEEKVLKLKLKMLRIMKPSLREDVGSIKLGKNLLEEYGNLWKLNLNG